MYARKLLYTVLILLILASIGYTQTPLTRLEQKYYLQVDIVVNAETGWPTRLIITGKVDQPVAWMGMSFYPYGVQDPITGGNHSFLELKEGVFQHEILVDPKFLGGSFEVGLWRKKVDKVDSTLDYDYWDKMYGFHVEDLFVYKSGLLTQLTGYQPVSGSSTKTNQK